jgi:hypothetical protein
MIARLKRSALYCLGLISLQIMLSGFYFSTKPLLGTGELTLGQQFRTAEINARGDIMKQPNGKPSVINFSASGLSYAGTWDDKKLRLTLREYDTAARLYSFQLEISNSDSSSPLITYGLMTIEGQTVQLFFPKENAQPETRDQLIDSLRALEDRLSSARKVRFAVATNPNQMTSIGNAIAKETSDTLATITSAAPRQAAADDDAAFPTDGYFSPAAFRSAYADALTPESFRSQSIYWFAFVHPFHADQECAHLVSDNTFNRFLILAHIGELNGILDSVTSQNRNYKVGDWGAAAKAAIDAAAPNLQREISFISHGQEDARLFYERHKCSGPVAERFFGNVAKIVARL